MSRTEFDLAEGPVLLARTPAVLDALLRGLPAAWTACDEGPRTFSPHGVLGHLVEGEEDDWIPRARTILERGEAEAFTPFDRFAQEARFADTSVEELLDLFARSRAASLATLAGWELRPEQLALTGLHPSFGRVTLGQLLATWVAHDLDHLAQVARVMAARHTQAVGPWRAYLPILPRDRAPQA